MKFSFFSKAKAKVRTSVPVHVALHSALSDAPVVEFFAGDIMRAETIAGGGIVMKRFAGATELTANDRDPSIGKNRIPTVIEVSFSLPLESTTTYILKFVDQKVQNQRLILVKESPSRYPESTRAAIVAFNTNSPDQLESQTSYLPVEAEFLNDYVHPWKIQLDYKPPQQEALPEYFLEIQELGPEAYFSANQLKLLAAIKAKAGFETLLAETNDQSLWKQNQYHINLFHWAVRLKNSNALHLLLRRWLHKQDLATSPFHSQIKTQGVPFVMAASSQEMAIEFLNAFPKITLVPHYQRGLEFGILLERSGNLAHLKGEAADLIIGQIESYKNLLMIVGGRAEDGDVKGLFQALDLLSPSARIPNFLSDNGVFEKIIKELARQSGLLVYYETESTSYKDRIPETRELIKSLKSTELELLKRLQTPTPRGLFFIAMDITEQGQGDKTRKMIAKPKVQNWALDVFANQKDFDRFYDSAAKNPQASWEKLATAYNEMRSNGILAGLLRDEQRQFVKRAEGYKFHIGATGFIKRGGRLYLVDTPLDH